MQRTFLNQLPLKCFLFCFQMAAKLYKGRKKAKWNGLSEIQENKLIELILSSDKKDDKEEMLHCNRMKERRMKEEEKR